ncbi:MULTISPECIES: MgtC/SapB family protein [Sphingobacterium]|jgi:putative Mg2+ transporter-C (MgtC) family protein|uniref:Magnesium transporter MgtC n=2 Tax=Sphingobacterium TaxID=28453 RepID=A0A420FHK7_9SPHI|nr:MULTISPECIES: MgtC/SapB family protein [Sphingobacterium]MBB1645408.1 magnesium transporter MgtC [Sphingobacterium sp. UME9]MCS4166157.1 putative Mg2+ transporter-C (MgtC) family protein [Sphingobacterium sp. BIGb0116]QMV69850.1 MgtC/SapB family protein [Sphingobacterium paramultivorum]QQT30762.1 MgtC/SapB family protein [Sphingobacterium multivorum]QRY58407.1 MgtC/SapB family protein [Sphingobacterium siyangense]
MDNLLQPFESRDVLLIMLSVLIGLLIGIEREYRNKSAGLRTFILVSFGSCLFTILSLKIGLANPDRLAANIITGIGFLGAGVIFKEDNKVSGITTATTIWAAASLGMCVGAGYIFLAFIGVGLVLAILALLTYLQTYIDNYHKIKDYELQTSSEADFEHTEQLIRRMGFKAVIVSQRYNKESLNTIWRLTGNVTKHREFVETVRRDRQVVAYQY